MSRKTCGRERARSRSSRLRRISTKTSGPKSSLPEQTFPGAPFSIVHRLKPVLLGAEEDVFALEHFHGDEDGRGRVDARGSEDQRDEVPVIRPGDDFLADQTGV